jgi:lipopolysaccharide export system permease protein
MARRKIVTVLDKMIALDLLKTVLATLFVIVTILVSQKFISVLGMAVKGQISSATVLTILGLKTIIVAVSFMPVAVFVAVLMVIGRMYRNQEMAALASAGGGIGALYYAVYLLVIPLSILAMWSALVAAPWAEATTKRLIYEDSKAADVRGIAAGKFSEYSQGDMVFYAEEISDDGLMHRVFAQHREQQNLSVIVSKAGRFKDFPGGRYLVLMDGERIQGQPGRVDFIIEYFAEYALRVEEKGAVMSHDRWTDKSSVLFASQDLEDIAELQRRIAVPLGILFLSALAIPLAQVTPRGGVYGNLFTAFLIYFTYANLQKAGQSWVAKGEIPVWAGYCWLYILSLLIMFVVVTKIYGMKWVLMQFRRRVV